MADIRELLDWFEARFEEHAPDELNAPASGEAIADAQTRLGVEFTEEFKQLYHWHDGQDGVRFVLDEFRFMPLVDVVAYNEAARQGVTAEDREIFDDTGSVKDTIHNDLWIQFGDNGGNTILSLDLDPGAEGVLGQVIGTCDGEPGLEGSSISDWLGAARERILSGEVIWDEEAGAYMGEDEFDEDDGDEPSAAFMKQLTEAIESGPDVEEVGAMEVGSEFTVVGNILNDGNDRYQLGMRGGYLTVHGELNERYGIDDWIEANIIVEPSESSGPNVYRIIESKRFSESTD